MRFGRVFEAIHRWQRLFERADAMATARMDRWGVPVLRAALGIVFVRFGALKVVRLSPADELVAATVYVVSPEVFVPVLGVWEVLIGLCLLYRPLIRLWLLLLFFQLPGTFLLDVVYTTFPYGLTMEGQ
nr:hypothetical protein [Natronomonas salsuginis]